MSDTYETSKSQQAMNRINARQTRRRMERAKTTKRSRTETGHLKRLGNSKSGFCRYCYPKL